MTFNEFVATRPITDNPFGDFVAEVQRNKDFPPVEKWAEIRDYVFDRRLRRGALAAAQSVWRAYLRAKRSK
ncbi:MAG: hypothetical protein E5Y55_26190 [Mesorhizobium sp.]|uniref:hypothetical protein n=1 Tax=Mesorhizobium sp. TaxID=1871066 RepID=UPI001201A73B|nr:hypothetical protein [Mesorhizobium sp.]TIM41065.1 MAG: hypothetical protein E5Y55_26190 [Mesorhizobium sp.]